MTLKELIFILWKNRFERKGFQEDFKPIFSRFIGIESNEYNDILKTLINKAKQDQEHCIVFDRDIPMQVDFDLINSTKRDLLSMDVTHLSDQDITMFADKDLNQIFLDALEYTTNLAIENENFVNDNVRNDFIVKLILNTFTYVHPLNISLNYEGTYKCFYYGDIAQRNIYFLILLHLMTFDVIYINPLKDEFWDKVDVNHLCEKFSYASIQEINSLEDRIKNANIIQANESMTLQFEKEIESEVFTNDSGLFKPWQLRGYKINQLLIKGNEIDINNNLKEPAKVRVGFKAENGIVTIPHFFFKIDGVNDDIKKYKEFVSNCVNCENCLIVKDIKDLFEDRISNNETLQLAFCQLSDSTIDPTKLKETPFYPFNSYSCETQNLIINKINELIKNPRIFKVDQLEKEDLLEVVSTILCINSSVQRLIDNFDFSSHIPKIIYFLERDKSIDKKTSIILSYLNLIGFDIIVFSPSGTSGLDNLIDSNYFCSIRFEQMKYDLLYTDVIAVTKETLNFFKKIFK